MELVFYQAALVSVPQSLQNPILINEVNVNGTLNLLKVAAESKVKRFIFASSCAVYGDTNILPISEENPLRLMCINIVQKDVDPTYSEPRQGDIRCSYADISNAKKKCVMRSKYP